ncbi:MAG: ATP-binding cassette domain-containing protein [Candidatus Atribacteria bacterium]|nr:ATP-binding cassette domain-containing protein [Candidatus Atribacteria bacterium]
MNDYNENPLLEVKNLKKYFPIKKSILKRKTSYLKAVDDVSFSIEKGETFGLVGESGCGKSTIARTIIRLYNVTGGNVIFDNQHLENLTDTEMQPIRKKMQMIFQDPYASLNTRMTVGDIIGEPLDIFKIAYGRDRQNIINSLLDKIGLSSKYANRYPHEFSGGQRQRIGIARALILNPQLIICDEPISALDVSIQAQIVNMLQDLQQELGLTYLFIAHDLSMVKYISDRIGVMYLGKLIELARSQDLYNNHFHPYTKALLSSIPIADPEKSKNRNRIILEGNVPSAINPPSGCRFRTRCVYSMKVCSEIEPELKEVSIEHKVACHLTNK